MSLTIQSDKRQIDQLIERAKGQSIGRGGTSVIRIQTPEMTAEYLPVATQSGEWIWLTTYTGIEESHTIREQGVRNALLNRWPDYELITEAESSFEKDE